ncbi:MAG: hypothetical protein JRN15_08130 [Nitrososphaerota archaeon]|nr:hypothetical protein [Nitrososphaerota archaeon]
MSDSGLPLLVAPVVAVGKEAGPLLVGVVAIISASAAKNIGSPHIYSIVSAILGILSASIGVTLPSYICARSSTRSYGRHCALVARMVAGGFIPEDLRWLQ